MANSSRLLHVQPVRGSVTHLGNTFEFYALESLPLTDGAESRLRFVRTSTSDAATLARRYPSAEQVRVTAADATIEVIDTAGRGDRTRSVGEVILRTIDPATTMLRVEIDCTTTEGPTTVAVDVALVDA